MKRKMKLLKGAPIFSALLLCTSETFAAPGDLDTLFSGDGVVSGGYSSYSEYVSSVVSQQNNKVIMVGDAQVNFNDDDFLLVRYNSDGSLDTTFGANGRVYTHFGAGDDKAIDVAHQSDGRIVACGWGEIINPSLARALVVAR